MEICAPKFIFLYGVKIIDQEFANKNLFKCFLIESNEVSNDTVMIRLRKGTYSRYFLWRVI